MKAKHCITKKTRRQTVGFVFSLVSDSMPQIGSFDPIPTF